MFHNRRDLLPFGKRPGFRQERGPAFPILRTHATSYKQVVRALTLITAFVWAGVWTLILAYGLNELDFIGCVFLPESSISGELLHKVVLPSAMLTLAMTSVILTILKNGIGRTALYLAAVSLIAVLVYYGLNTGMSVNKPLASECRH